MIKGTHITSVQLFLTYLPRLLLSFGDALFMTFSTDEHFAENFTAMRIL